MVEFFDKKKKLQSIPKPIQPLLRSSTDDNMNRTDFMKGDNMFSSSPFEKPNPFLGRGKKKNPFGL